MRTWSLDQFEFDDPASEEALDIAVAKRSKFPFPDVGEFVASAVGVDASRQLPQPMPFDDHTGVGGLRTESRSSLLNRDTIAMRLADVQNDRRTRRIQFRSLYAR